MHIGRSELVRRSQLEWHRLKVDRVRLPENEKGWESGCLHQPENSSAEGQGREVSGNCTRVENGIRIIWPKVRDNEG